MVSSSCASFRLSMDMPGECSPRAVYPSEVLGCQHKDSEGTRNGARRPLEIDETVFVIYQLACAVTVRCLGLCWLGYFDQQEIQMEHPNH